MALKEMISSWDDGVKSYESGDYSTALGYFQSISEPSAKIYFNLSCVSAKLGRIRDSIKVTIPRGINPLYRLPFVCLILRLQLNLCRFRPTFNI